MALGWPVTRVVICNPVKRTDLISKRLTRELFAVSSGTVAISAMVQSHLHIRSYYPCIFLLMT